MWVILKLSRKKDLVTVFPGLLNNLKIVQIGSRKILQVSPLSYFLYPVHEVMMGNPKGKIKNIQYTFYVLSFQYYSSVMILTRWFSESPTYINSLFTTVIPTGSLNCASLPNPSKNPSVPLPANVSTVLLVLIILIL